MTSRCNSIRTFRHYRPSSPRWRASATSRLAVAADRLSQALAPSLRLRLLELLSEAALEVSSQLRAGHVEIRLAGQEPSLVYVEHEEEAPAPPPGGRTHRPHHASPARLAEDVGRGRGEPKEGVSVNTWIVKALARGLTSAVASGGRIGSRLTGYGQS